MNHNKNGNFVNAIMLRYAAPKVEKQAKTSMGQQNKDDLEKARERLYAGLTPEQREEAEQNLKEYVALVWRVLERLEDDPVAHDALCREIDKMRDGETKFDSPRGDA